MGPISPSLASLLLLLNKSSWDMSRRKIFIGKFHLHSTPHLFRLSSQAPKEKELRKKKEVCLPLPSLLICSLAQMTWGYACRSGHSSPHTSWHRVCRNPPPSPTQPSALLDSLPQVKILITHPRVSGELARQSPRNLGREKQVAFLSRGCNTWDYFIKV